MKSWLRFLIFTILFAGLAYGVFAEGQDEATTGKTYKVIVVVHGGITDPFWKKVEDGANLAGSRWPDLEVSYIGPSVYNFEEFMSYIEAAIASKPDVLVCSLTGPVAMDEPLRRAMADGLPVIGMTSPDLREPESARIPVLTFVGEDSYGVGVTAAKETLKRFTPKRAVFLNHHPGAAQIDSRGGGWIDVMKENGIPVEQLDITADAVQGAEVTAAYMKRHPDTDAIFCTNTVRATTVIQRLEDDGINVGSDVMYAQMDLAPNVFDLIEEGKIMFTMDQQPFLQGFLGVQLAYMYAKWGLIPASNVSTGPTVITKDNLPAVRELTEQGIR